MDKQKQSSCSRSMSKYDQQFPPWVRTPGSRGEAGQGCPHTVLVGIQQTLKDPNNIWPFVRNHRQCFMSPSCILRALYLVSCFGTLNPDHWALGAKNHKSLLSNVRIVPFNLLILRLGLSECWLGVLFFLPINYLILPLRKYGDHNPSFKGHSLIKVTARVCPSSLCMASIWETHGGLRWRQGN